MWKSRETSTVSERHILRERKREREKEKASLEVGSNLRHIFRGLHSSSYETNEKANIPKAVYYYHSKYDVQK